MAKSKVIKSVPKSAARRQTLSASKTEGLSDGRPPETGKVQGAVTPAALPQAGSVAKDHDELSLDTNGRVTAKEPVKGAALKGPAGVDLGEKIKELVRMAQEQGYLTYADINDALPDGVISPDDLDEVYVRLRSLEVEIVAQAEGDRVEQVEAAEGEERERLDI